MSKKFPSGVITGDGVQAIFNDAQEHEYALPAVNVVGTNSVNAVLETVAAVNSPVMVQFSNGGGSFFAGKSLDNTDQRSATPAPCHCETVKRLICFESTYGAFFFDKPKLCNAGMPVLLPLNN